MTSLLHNEAPPTALVLLLDGRDFVSGPGAQYLDEHVLGSAHALGVGESSE